MNTLSRPRGPLGLLTLAATSAALVTGLISTTRSQDETRMPSFTLQALDASSFSSTSLAGRVTLVDFWATWCEPCLQEIPHWNTLRGRYREQGLEVLGITVQSGSAAQIRASVEKLDIKYAIVIGDEDVVKGFGGRLWAFPRHFSSTALGASTRSTWDSIRARTRRSNATFNCCCVPSRRHVTIQDDQRR